MLHVACDSATPSTRPFMPYTENKQSGPSLYLRIDFACFRSLGNFAHPSSVSRLSKVPHCCADQLGPLLRQEAGHVLKLGLAQRTHPHLIDGLSATRTPSSNWLLKGTLLRS